MGRYVPGCQCVSHGLLTQKWKVILNANLVEVLPIACIVSKTIMESTVTVASLNTHMTLTSRNISETIGLSPTKSNVGIRLGWLITLRGWSTVTRD